MPRASNSRGREGAESVMLSGGYEDDEDFGNEILYTGHGGRDPETGKQVSDQRLIRGNAALAYNQQVGLPVRVIRGATHCSPYSPRIGYRYDGLYRVDEYWRARGRSGFLIWRYRLVKLATIASRNTGEPQPDQASNRRGTNHD